MSRKVIMAGIAGCVLLTAPVGTSPTPVAMPSVPEVAAQELSGAAVELDERPVVVPSGTTARQVAAAALAADTTDPAEVPGVVLDAYTTAVALAPKSCRLTVETLAAVGQVESGNLVGQGLDSEHRVTPALVGPRLDGGAFKAVPDTDNGRLDGDKKWDRAVGPMQFLPSTWRSVAVDIDGDGERDPQDVYDAAGAAMVYLCASRDLSDPAQLREAVLSYNRSAAYVAQVLAWKETFEREGLTRQPSPSFAAFQVSGLADLSPVQAVGPVSDLPLAKPVKQRRPDAKPSAKPAAKPSAAPSGKPTTPSAQPSPTTPATPRPGTPTAPTPGDPTPTPATPTPTPSPSPDPEPSPSPTPSDPAPSPPFVMPETHTDLPTCEDVEAQGLEPALVTEDEFPLVTETDDFAETGLVVLPAERGQVSITTLCRTVA